MLQRKKPSAFIKTSAGVLRALRAWIVVAWSLLMCPAALAQTACDADVDGSGAVNAQDLALVLGAWGACQDCPADISGDSLVDAVDISIVLSRWGGVCLAPTISSVVPLAGPTTGGTLITITGTNLTGTTSVTVGGAAATGVTVVNATTVTAVTPAGTEGAKTVSVTTPGGTASLADSYTFFAPLAWATVLEQNPDPAVVTSATLRNAIAATGYPWRVRDNGTQIEMVLIPPGTFTMGCSASNQYACSSVESPVHSVTLTSAFYMGRYEVTQAQWQARMGSNPSFFQSASAQVTAAQVPNRPVEQVSWNMVAGAGGFLSGTGLRLPTEAEWEYAYRASTTTAFHGFAGSLNGTSDDTLVGNIAWYTSNSTGQTRPVGGKLANGFGLHDMSGNVWEWVNDWYSSSYYTSSPSTNPPGPVSGTQRVLRGGAWYDSSYFERSSLRNFESPSFITGTVGFRVARAPL
jgi:formylglycine-generating enzyme required for sulfatase activity